MIESTTPSIPLWAVPSAALKLVKSAVRHPRTATEIVVDHDARKVSVVPADEASSAPERAHHESAVR